jgi:ATPase subunit of ABC transporter with duplicated ATPase domains
MHLGVGDVLGIVGPNGAGKTTLLRMITGEQQPTTGTVKIHPSAVFGYNSQLRAELHADNPVWYEIVGGEELVAISPTETMPARRSVPTHSATQTLE